MTTPTQEQLQQEIALLKQDLRSMERWYWYRNRYLQSFHWYNLREKKFSEVGQSCEICGSQDEIAVHHLRYKEIFDVETSDLQVLCGLHHREAHGMNPGQKRPPRRKKTKAEINKARKKAIRRLKDEVRKAKQQEKERRKEDRAIKKRVHRFYAAVTLPKKKFEKEFAKEILRTQFLSALTDSMIKWEFPISLDDDSNSNTTQAPAS